MKKHALTLGIVVALASTSGHAAYNLYKNDGLSFDVNGEVNLYADKQSPTLTGQSPILARFYQDLSDERLRLNTASSATWVDFRASQDLPNNYRATGTIGMGYLQGGGTQLNNANLSIDKLNVGAITFGRQYLHTGYVTRTGTYTPLDVFGEQAIRLDYYGLNNLHTSAYYLLPSSNDVRRRSDGKIEGFGASASYVVPFSDNHSLRLATGYSKNRAFPSSSSNTALNGEGVAASAEYRFGKLLAAADFGKQDAKYRNQWIANSSTDIMSFKVGYEITPKFNLMAGYGIKESKANRQTGIDQTAIEQQLATVASREGGTSLLSTILYDNYKEQQSYVRGDYYLRDNVRLYGIAEQAVGTGKVADVEYAKFKDNSYRLGVSLSF